jgi:DNA-binding transcriptional regulator YiaG
VLRNDFIKPAKIAKGPVHLQAISNKPDSSSTSLALLGIAQRQIRIKRAPDTGITRNRKAFPSETKTPGDSLRRTRREAGLTQQQLSALIGVPIRDIQNWERDEIVPTEAHSRDLAEILQLKIAIPRLNPIADWHVGVCTQVLKNQ